MVARKYVFADWGVATPLFLPVHSVRHNDRRAHGGIGTDISMPDVTGKSIEVAGLQDDALIVGNTQQ